MGCNMMYPAIPRYYPGLECKLSTRLVYLRTYQRQLLIDMAVGIKALEKPRNSFQMRRLLAARANERHVRKVMNQLDRYYEVLINGN